MTTDTGPETFEHNPKVPIDKIGAEVLARRVEVPPISEQSWKVTKGDVAYIVRGDTMTEAYDRAAEEAGLPVEQFLAGSPVLAEKIAPRQNLETEATITLDFED